MNLFINRKSPVPIHDQLVAQIGQLVACGALSPGERIPSIRALATRLQIHHNTILAAYKQLEQQGVLEVRKGSGVRVAEYRSPSAAWREGLALKAMAAHYVTQAFARGHDEAAILEACRTALARDPVSRVVVVNPHFDLQRLYLHELGETFVFPMEGMTLDQVAELPATERRKACFLTSTNHAASLRQMLDEEHHPIVVRLAPIEPLLEQAKRHPPEALVGIVSVSSRLRFLIREFLSSVCEEPQLLDVPFEDPERLRGAVRLADWVITDSCCHQEVARISKVPAYRFRLLTDEALDELLQRLPPEAFLPERSL